MNLLYFDTHTHFEEYGNDAAAIAEAMREKGIGACAVSVKPGDYEQAVQLKENNPYIIPAAGIHPWHAADFSIDWESLEPMFQSCQVIGEIGLDRKWADPSSFSKQIEVFIRQLDLACRYHKPVNLHTSGADQEVLHFLRTSLPPGVLIHWFDGPIKVLYQYLDLGCTISVASDVDTSRRKRSICRSIPQDRLLCETDGPKAIVWGLKRAPCAEDYQPDAIIQIYRRTAAVCGIQPEKWEEFCRQVTKNAMNVFKI
ncbi:MAG: TatD family hydrolase [Christensenellales bacterium]